MEKTNLTFSQVVDIMEVGEFAIIISGGGETAPSGRKYMGKPAALFWDEKDDCVLKSTVRKDNFGIEICKKPKDLEPILYNIVDAEGFVNYLMSFMGIKEKGVEE